MTTDCPFLMASALRLSNDCGLPTVCLVKRISFGALRGINCHSEVFSPADGHAGVIDAGQYSARRDSVSVVDTRSDDVQSDRTK